MGKGPEKGLVQRRIHMVHEHMKKMFNIAILQRDAN